MRREYVKIYCCGDCIQYNLKNHKCNLGAKDEGKAQDHFYRDCPLGINVDEEVSIITNSNQEIKVYAKENGVLLWRVAEKMKMSDVSFSKMLRKELSDEKKKEIKAIIDELAKES